MKSFTHSRRYFGFDLIRIISMFAIVVFHVTEAVFWTDSNPLMNQLHFYRISEAFSQHITFSGFTVIALSFFLIGQGRLRNFVPLLVFLILGIIVLASFQEDPPFTGFYWEWDIYAFLFVSLLCLQILVFAPRLHALVAVLAFMATWVPAWKILPNKADVLSQALIGICPPQGVGAWPLLPWLAWPVLFFCLGSCYRQYDSFRNHLQTLRLKESAVWIVLLGASIPGFGGFYGVSLGPGFYCHTLRLEPILFWSTMIWLLFLMRLSLVVSWNEWAGRYHFVQFISNLRWNRRFGVTYLVHLPLLGLGMVMRDWFYAHPQFFEIYFASVLVLPEILVRLSEYRVRLKQ